MIIQAEEKDDITVLRLSGRLDGSTMQIVEDEFLKWFEAGGRCFIYDLSQLEYISSAGLRVMLLSLKKAKAQKGLIVLFGLNDNVKEVFDISGFSKIFQIVHSEEEAWQSVS